MAFASSFVCFLLFHLLIIVQGKGRNDSTCPKSFSCGNLTNLSFPLALSTQAECGIMTMSGCNAKPYPRIQLVPGGYRYYATGKPYHDALHLVHLKLRTILRKHKCQAFNKNFSLIPDSPLISFNIISPNIRNFFKCNSTTSIPNIAGLSKMYSDCKGFSIYYQLHSYEHIPTGNLTANCSLIRLPIDWRLEYSNLLFEMLSPELTVEWKLSDDCNKCHYGGGECQIDHTTNKFHCHKDAKMNRSKFRHEKMNKSKLRDAKMNRSKLRVTLGAGKLKDGREVAVKRLYEHNCKRLEQFVNEIEILTRLRHANLVTLYGCTSRRSRELLLVYEYIPNGTLADHLHADRAKNGPLTWPIRMKIAIETAGALAYLHASDIIHCDVMTNNILLDHNFSVKVADFGISRLFPNDVSHISTTPRGTLGYIDPKYNECYQLTSKSDVYSFGVVLAELISSMPPVDMKRHNQEINLANYAINKIVNSAFSELIDPSLGFVSDSKIWKMTTSVAKLAFLCLQTDRDMRPTMVDVLDTLKEIQANEFEFEKRLESNLYENEAKMVVTPFRMLRQVKSLPSPDSVTDKWITCSHITSTTS